MAESSDDLGIPMKPARPAVAPAPTTPVRPAGVPPRTPDVGRPADPLRAAESARLSDPLRRPSETSGQPRPSGELRRLSVGPEITLSGEINSCDKLFIEGSVEANLTNCRDVDIAESGLFKGSASIEEAEVRGRFEGNLVVRKRLLIKASGRVSGTIRYGQIEIECGGQISGDIQAQPAGETSEAMPDVAPVRVVS
ncbi:MAG: polymer-forming cytoskeletal protein [Alphaproteobacteria bacterium]|nr:polymer-forming cytoskeletal protein [Alphaproteobacteria bacterium]